MRLFGLLGLVLLAACSPLNTLYPEQDMRNSSGVYFMSSTDVGSPGFYDHVLPVSIDGVFVSGPMAQQDYQLNYLNIPSGQHELVLRLYRKEVNVFWWSRIKHWISTERDLSKLNSLPLNQITGDGFIRLQLELNLGYIYLFAPDIADGKVRGVLQRKI